MRIVPDSQVVFYSNVDIIPGEQHLAFQNRTQRDAYFASKVTATYTNTSMVRKDGTLMIDASVITPATLFGCNYLSFVNPSWGNKRFYGFIVDVDYMNNETMIVKWTLDEFESWRFEAQYDEMTIEREAISGADSLKNPYDPSILEFRTAETLPIGEDTEKPYYTIGDSANNDGVFIGERLCSELNVNNTLGVLITFCDIDLKSLDTGSTGSNRPSLTLKNIMTSVNSITGSPTSFSIMSPATYQYYASISQAPSSRYCFNSSVWGQMYPLACSRITPPISYIYLDGAITPTSENSDVVTGKLAQLLEWFTQNSLTDSIIGMYPLTAGMVLFSGSRGADPYYVGARTAVSQNVRNKKLDLYPFSYYRLIGPNGDVKELKIENFLDAQEDATDPAAVKVAVAFDAVDTPSLVAAPVNYRCGGISPHALTTNANTLESIIFSQFPTLPYVISGWESQKAAIANAIIANNTTEYGYQQELAQLNVYNSRVNAAFEAADTVGSVLSLDVAGVARHSSNFALGMAGADVNQQILKNRWAQSEEAYDVLLGKEDTAIDENFKYARPAYAQNKYYRNNGAGMTNFLNFAYCDILLLKVTLNPDILAKYDEYFDRYGYASGRIGIPRVINYMNGATSPADLPLWTTTYHTYVKTANCTVRNVPMPVASAIEQMFNSGIRFYGPDLS